MQNQAQEQSDRPEFQINKIENDPSIDGNVLKDSVWVKIPALTDLKQIKPVYGQAASEKTEIRLP